MRYAFVRALACAVVAFVSAQAAAHGPQIQTTNDSDKIVTRRIVPDGSYETALSPATSVYVMPLAEYLGVWRAQPDPSTELDGTPSFIGWPGFAYGYGYDATTNPEPFPAGSSFVLGFTAGLKSWNGAAFLDAGDVQAQAYRGASAAPSALATTTDAGPFASLVFPTGAGISYASSGGDVHNTVNYRLLGDGVSPTSPLADGVYLLSLQLASTSTAVAASDPFFFVLTKNPDPGAVDAAVDSLGFDPQRVQNLAVPEPAALLPAMTGGLAAVRLLRRRPGARR